MASVMYGDRVHMESPREHIFVKRNTENQLSKQRFISSSVVMHTQVCFHHQDSEIAIES